MNVKTRLKNTIENERRSDKVPQSRQLLQKSLTKFAEVLEAFFDSESISKGRKEAVINALDDKHVSDRLEARIADYTDSLQNRIRINYGAQLLKLNASIVRTLTADELDDYINDDIADVLIGMRNTLTQFGVHN